MRLKPYRGRHAARPVVPWRLIRRSLTGLALAVLLVGGAGTYVSAPSGPSYVPPAYAEPAAPKQPPSTSTPSKEQATASKTDPAPGSAPSVERSTARLAAAGRPVSLDLSAPSPGQASPPGRAPAPDGTPPVVEQEAPAQPDPSIEAELPATSVEEDNSEEGNSKGKLKHEPGTDPQPDRGQDDQHRPDKQESPRCE